MPPPFIARHGPYQFVKHPIYLAYMLFAAAHRAVARCRSYRPINPMVALPGSNRVPLHASVALFSIFRVRF
jgi:protein-S-isoprenylcysteine O-methyltransferase Ste14